MSAIRYGAREVANEEVAATSAGDIWSTIVTAWWETDPDVVAAVLPRPLEPADEPLVRVVFATVEFPGRPPFGAGTVSVMATHDGRLGDYALVMPMTTEQAVIGGRETFGEPKKLGDVVVERDGDAVHAAMTRMGTTFVELNGSVTGSLPLAEPEERVSFYFKFLMSPDGKGFDDEPSLVHCFRVEDVRSLEAVDAEVVLRDSPFDPVADLPVRRLREVTIREARSTQRGEIATRVPSEWLLPFAHQRYDYLPGQGAK